MNNNDAKNVASKSSSDAGDEIDFDDLKSYLDINSITKSNFVLPKNINDAKLMIRAKQKELDEELSAVIVLIESGDLKTPTGNGMEQWKYRRKVVISYKD